MEAIACWAAATILFVFCKLRFAGTPFIIAYPLVKCNPGWLVKKHPIYIFNEPYKLVW
jgi:hypothetical protein